MKLVTYLTPVGLLISASASAEIISTGHNDIGVIYESGALDMEVHAEDLNEEFHPNDVLFYVGENARLNNDAGFSFLGVPTGAQYWRLFDEELPDRLTVGIGAEEIDANEPGIGAYVQSDSRWNSSDPARWIKVSLLGYTGPGHVSLWGSGDNGPVVYWATSDGVDGTDYALAVAGSHGDLNWGFSAAGFYDLRLQASAFDPLGNLVSSDEYTYHFGVEAVPEPGTVAALGLGVLALLRRRKS